MPPAPRGLTISRQVQPHPRADNRIILSTNQLERMIYQTVLVAAIVASASAGIFPTDPKHQKNLWEAFKRDHFKNYDTMEEESRRFGHFLENLKQADRRNELERRAGGSAVHGITRFSDLSQAEFESRFLTADVSQANSARKVEGVQRTVDTAAGLVDWTGVYTTPVKNQVSTLFSWL